MVPKLYWKFSFLIAFSIFIYCSSVYEYLFATSYQHYTHWGSSEPLTILILKDRNKSIFANGFYILESDKCKKHTIDILLLVKSKNSNFELRKAIRHTWGNDTRFVQPKIRTIFMLGKTRNKTLLQKKIHSESNLYGDIVQGDFIDCYLNNTWKTQMTVDWAFHNCHSNYYVLIDDDYFLSPNNLIKYLKSPHSYPKIGNATNLDEYLYAGYVFPNSAPIRYYLSKWYMPLKDYKYSRWPPYVTGGISILAHKSFSVLYLACQHTNFFRIDDIYLGMAAKKGGLQLTHQKEIYFDKKFHSKNNYRHLIASHGYNNASELLDVFNKQVKLGAA